MDYTKHEYYARKLFELSVGTQVGLTVIPYPMDAPDHKQICAYSFPDKPTLQGPRNTVYDYSTDAALRSWINQVLNDSSSVELSEWELQCVSKVGWQGRVPSFEMVDKALRQYAHTVYKSYYSRDMIAARDRLIMYINWIKQHTPGIEEYHHQEVPVRATAASNPFYCRKTDQSVLEYCRDHHVRSIEFIYPNIVGYRDQRGKLRIVFFASAHNYFLIIRQQDYIQNFLRRYVPGFESWWNDDLFVRPQITKAIEQQSRFLMIDFKSKDQNFPYDLYHLYITPINAAIIGTQEADRMDSFVYHSCWNPHILNGMVYLGQKNGPSGELWVPPGETILGCLYNDAIRHHFNLRTTVGLSIGDDMLLGWTNPGMGQEPLIYAKALASELHEVISEEKSACDSRFPDYKRRKYHPSFPRNRNGDIIGCYPLLLAYNSIAFPENAGNHAENWIATLQRLDNLEGHPHGADFCTRFFKQHVHYGQPTGHVRSKVVYKQSYREELPWTSETSFSSNILKIHFPEIASSISEVVSAFAVTSED